MNNLVQQSTCQIHWSWVEVQRELLEKQKEGVKETGFSWMTCRPSQKDYQSQVYFDISLCTSELQAKNFFFFTLCRNGSIE